MSRNDPQGQDVGELSLLFVEDEPDVRHIVELALSRATGISITCFESGLDALDHARAAQHRYDVCLLNVLLRDMHGGELSRQLRELPATRDATILFVTGLVPANGIQSYRDVGGDDVILKPFNVLELADRIRAAHAIASAGRATPAANPRPLLSGG